MTSKQSYVGTSIYIGEKAKVHTIIQIFPKTILIVSGIAMQCHTAVGGTKFFENSLIRSPNNLKR